MKIKAIFLDCGGVMIMPTTGDWQLSPGYEDVIGEDFAGSKLDEFRRIRRQFVRLLPDANEVDSLEQEYAMFCIYYKAVFEALGMPLSDAQAQALAQQQVYIKERYMLFDDVLPSLDRWQAQYRMGIISDAPPSTGHIMEAWGVADRIHAPTYSCQLGILKPNPAIYQHALDRLGVKAEESVFLEDMIGNLEGARAVGMHAIQIRRKMPPLFPVEPVWDGPVAHSFAEVDALLREMV